MKEETRGKAVEAFSDALNFSAASEFPCSKHPNSSSIGICAYCLKERLVKLVCSDCGEQRLSSCSCSDVSSSSYRNSCSTMEVGSVGRVSFLIENDDPHPKSRSKQDIKSSQQVIFLRRSSSSCVRVKKSNGFWKIKRLFIRNKLKNNNNDEFRSEIWGPDFVGGVSRSRSLCSFRNRDLDDQSSDCAFSSAKISDVTNGVFLDPDHKQLQWGFLNNDQSDPSRRSSGYRGGNVVFDAQNGIDNLMMRGGRNGFPAKESDFRAMDESAFIDLKVDLSSAESGGSASQNGAAGVNDERGLKRRGHKVWKWIMKYHHHHLHHHQPANNKREQI